MEESFARAERPSRVVELFDDLNVHPFLPENTISPPDIFELYGMLRVGLVHRELRPFPSKPPLAATSRDSGCRLVHIGRA